MAEKRKSKKNKKEEVEPTKEEELKTSKLQKSIATYMYKNVPTKKTKFLNHQVNYFHANKAVDCLLDSSWATGDDPMFTDRVSVVTFLNTIMSLTETRYFHRAKKLAVTDQDLSPKELRKKQEKQKKKKLEEKEKKKDAGSDSQQKENENDENTDDKNNDDKDAKKKRKRKVKLDMHLDQVFLDGTDAYVWMWSPVPFWYYLVGGFFLFAAIAVCLFPLWPPSVRNGVYYLCVAAAGFLGVILGLAVVRFIVFILIWCLSVGRHHLWILPNLTEDVGFFESFWPLYHYEYKGSAFEKKKKSKKKQNSEEVLKEEHDNQSALDTDKGNSGVEGTADENSCVEGTADENSCVEGTADEENNSGDNGSSSSESDTNSNSQAFEMVDKDDIPATDEQ